MCFRPPTAEAPKKCEKCGKENDPGVPVCVECGNDLKSSAAPGVPPVPGAPSAPSAPGPAGPPKAPPRP